jgi:hypothetical protein
MFATGIGALITLNTICMGLELDQHEMASANEYMFSFSGHQHIPQAFFDGFEAFFFTAFALEFLVRAFVFRSHLIWEVATYIDLLALLPAVLLWSLGLQSGKQLTLLRIVRLVKLFRLLRIFRLSKELNMLAKSMATAMRALVWIALLLLITVYCAAIVCTTVIGQNSSFNDTDPAILSYENATNKTVAVRRYWGSLMRSMLTLFQIFTLDDWNSVVRPVVETHQPWMLVFFIAFIFVTTFGLLNLLMGTIVDRAMHIAKEYEEEKERLVQCEQKQMLLATVRLFSLMDEDGNGEVSAREMMTFLDSNDIQKALEQEMRQFHIQLDYTSLLEICRLIAEEWFDASSPEQDGITVEEFAGAASRLHGLARSQDMLTVLMTCKASLTRVEMCECSLAKLQEASERQEAKVDKVLEAMMQMSGEKDLSKGAPTANSQKTTCSSHISGWQLGDQRSTATSSFCDGDRESPRLVEERRINSEPNLPLPGAAYESEEFVSKVRSGYTTRQVSNESDDLKKLNSNQGTPQTPLGLDRRSFQRAGTSSMQGLLKDLKGFEEFFKTDTAAAIRDYSTMSPTKRKLLRARSTVGEGEKSQSQPPIPKRSSSFADNSNRRWTSESCSSELRDKVRARPVQAQDDSSNELRDKVSAWCGRRQGSSESLDSISSSMTSRGSPAQRSSAAQREPREGLDAGMSKSGAPSQASTSQKEFVADSCTSILPCAVPSPSLER